MAVEFSIYYIITAEPIKTVWWGGEFLVTLGGALVKKVPAADCELWKGDF